MIRSKSAELSCRNLCMHLLDPKFPTDYNSSTTGFQVEKVRHIVYLCENNKKQIGTYV